MLMEEQLRELIDSFCEMLAGNAAAVSEIMSGIEKAGADQVQELNRACEIVHQVTGASGSMGFPEMSVVAGKLERAVRTMGKAGGIQNNEELEQLFALHKEFISAAEAVSPDDSELFETDLSAIMRPAAAR